MKWNRLGLAVGIIWFGFAGQAPAQTAKEERDALAQLTAKADKGDAQAQLKLGGMYASGDGVDRDFRKATKYYRMAADQGLARAEYELALDYANGYGVKENEREALKWFRKAANQGLVEAQVDLGRAYANGRGVSPSEVEAVRWFRKAAEQGSAPGKYELARSYLEGDGVSKDVEEGMQWLKPAAEEGYARAQNRLGECYTRGEGVNKDLVQAYKWFDLAEGQDEENAADIKLNLAKVETQMTKDQIAEAQKLAREFKPASANTNAPATTASVSTGLVAVKTDDDRSEVFVDGAFVGNSPATLKLAAGPHVVEVKRTGFKPYRRELQVSAGADLNLKVELEKE
jgi:TPR repeat protein